MKIPSALLVLIALCAPALAQSSKATLNTEVSTNFPDNTTGAITPAILRTTSNDMIASWQQAPTVNAQTGASYAFVVGDYGKLVTFNNGSAVAVTLPQATTTFASWNTFACNLGAGLVTITPTTSTIGGTATLAIPQTACFAIVSDGTNYQIQPYIPAIGNSGTYVRAAGMLGSAVSQTSTGATTAEQTLQSITIPANALDVVGRCFEVTAWGLLGSDGNTKNIRLKLGASVLLFITGNGNGFSWGLNATVCKTGSNTQTAYSTSVASTSVAATNVASATAVDTVANNLIITGQNGTASAGDIVSNGLIVKWWN